MSVWQDIGKKQHNFFPKFLYNELMHEESDKPIIFKILFWLVLPIGLILAIAFAALLIGTMAGTKSVGKYQAEIFIREKPSEVYLWLTEKEKLIKWVAGLEERVPITRDGLYIG